MTLLFPDLPGYSGVNRPLRFEGSLQDLEVIGEIPADLAGTFFRAGADPQYPPLAPPILFDGDGIVSAFTFADGHVDFAIRYVQTARFMAEREARRALFGLYRNPFTDDPSVAGMSRAVANTNVVFHAGKLLALKEDGLPHALDPYTLETLGPWDFGGGLTAQTFTAHPKIDPVTGELVGYAYSARGEATNDIALYVADAVGRVTNEIWFEPPAEAPYSAMIHDFGVTPNYAILPLIPLSGDLERMKGGGLRFQWEPHADIFFGVVPRNGRADEVRWFRAPNGFPGHIANAFEQDGKIILDLDIIDGNPMWFFPDGNGHVANPATLSGAIKRFTFDLSAAGDRVEGETLAPVQNLFTHCDDRFTTQPYRHVFGTLSDRSQPYDTERAGPITGAHQNGWRHVDLRTGAVQTWFPGLTATVQEPVFAPRSINAAEGDGYLVGLINQLAARRTEVVILDALNIAAGPVATVLMPMLLRSGFHGNWVPEYDLPPRK